LLIYILDKFFLELFSYFFTVKAVILIDKSAFSG